MYLDYFGLTEAPFSITPDPSFIYLSGRHRNALAHLLHGVGTGGGGGFVQLTGEVGTGKTTLCRALLEQVPPETHIALILNPLMNPTEMLAAICEELGIYTGGVEDSTKSLVDRLNGYLLEAHARGERVVLVIDEAQNLSIESLEQVRLLTNLETSKEKLLQIILLGQPELRELLQRRSLRQLAQRITARYHLTPLEAEETARYVGHRLSVAGCSRNPFSRKALKALHQRSQGIPRLVNIIADRALTGAYAAEQDGVDARLVHAAADEVQLGEPRVGVSRHWPKLAGVAAAATVVLSTGWFAGQWFSNSGPATDPPAIRTEVAASPATGASDDADKPALPATSPPPAGPESSESAGRLQTASAEPASSPPDAAAGPDSYPVSGESSAAVGSEQTVPNRQAITAAETVAVPAATSAQSPGTPDGTGPQMADAEPAGPQVDEAWFEEQDLRAWQGLAERWGRAQDAALLQASCMGREGLGFACLEDQGNWLRIRQLGLPVILVLQGSRAQQHLLLSGMEGDQLLVGTGPEQTSTGRDAIESRWYGAYFVAWPQAANWPREVARGDTGEPVDLILEMSTQAGQPYAGEPVFEEAFERWLMSFQVRNGLEPDGIVGPKTLLYLMRFSIDEPRLITAVDAGS